MAEPATTSTIPFTFKAFTAFTTVACVVLSILLLRATAANRALQHSFSEAIEKVGSAGLAVGEQVESLSIAGMKGGESLPVPSAALTFGDGRTGTLLLLMSGGCDTCTFSIPYFSRIAALAETMGLVAVGVQLDAASEADFKYGGETGFPVVAVKDSPRTWLRRVPIVPAIVLLDAEGGVKKTYFGELSPKQQDDVESLIRNWSSEVSGVGKKKAPPPGP
ncbi:MAG: hypothetical protein JNK58_05395 [Phycisphaerae bacterium]|nr:hypothetical protein [Phycisphaerae bacterium]